MSLKSCRRQLSLQVSRFQEIHELGSFMQCIGLDIGSTTIKGAVLDLNQRDICRVVQRPFPQPKAGLPSGFFEVDPQAVVNATEEVATELLGHAPEAKAIFCSGQMGGMVLVDPSGDALTNYLSWRDQRTSQVLRNSNSYLQAIRERWAKGELSDLGNELQAGSASSLLFWLAQHNQLPPVVATPVTIADFVLGRLCRCTPKMDPTQAIGLLDLKSGKWHLSAFEALGLSAIRWPQLANYREPIGTWNIQGKQLACHASFGDQPCALKGIELSQQELSINVSTGSQVSRLTESFLPGPYQSRYYFDGAILNTITHLPAGRSLNVLFDLLAELARAEGVVLNRAWEYIANSTEKAAGGGLDTKLSFFAGPLGHCGHIEGITTENLTVGNLFYAAFRSMADNYRDCMDRLCADRKGFSLALSGGLTRSMPALRQLIEDRFRMPIRDTAVTEETLLGLLEIASQVYLPEPPTVT
jgi:sugar (pentulose or hexulose) kinase